MLLRTAILLLLATVVAGILEIPELHMSEEQLQALYPLDEAAVSNGLCQMNTASFGACQGYFDEYLKIDSSVQWKDSAKLALLVKKLMIKPDFQNYINVCQARQIFYSCMGTNYFSCINRYAMLSRPGATWENVMPYIKLWEHLDFMCNAGFELAQQNWLAINRVEVANATQLTFCRNNFQNTLKASNWNHICSPQLVPAFAQCNQQVFSQGCGQECGWFACEDTRVGYARDCPSFRCNVV